MMLFSIVRRPVLAMIALMVALSVPIPIPAALTQTGAVCWTFPETGKHLCGNLLDYWRAHGGLARFGLPLSEQDDPEPGSANAIQYFERAVFMPRTSSAERDPVVLAPLAANRLRQNYQTIPGTSLPAQSYSEMPGDKLDFWKPWYPLSGAFLRYWQTHGGPGEFGYPVSPLLKEESELDGNMYLVQYFQTAVFEYHPENTAPYNVLLSQLGTIAYKQTHWGPEDLLQGDWCGPHMSIKGGKDITFDISTWGEFSEPVVLVFGRFNTRGVYELPFGEYGRDWPGRMQEVQYRGKVVHDNLTLSFIDNWGSGQSYTATKGQCP